MTNKELIERLQRASKALTRATTWEGSITRMRGAELQYLFEFACYLHLLRQFKQNYSLGLVKRTKAGSKIACWPKAPSDKAQWSYFTLKPRSGTGKSWQLCAGTGIEDIHGQERHPDISLQTAEASDTPCHHEVTAIWDAKFRKKPTSRMSSGDVASFIMFMRQLEIAKKPVPAPLAFAKKGSAASGLKMASASGLITNGEYSTEPTPMLVAEAVQETASYWTSTKHRP